MRLERRVSSNLDELVEAIAPVEGVVAVILFGSYARGEYDESSDYDLLVIFKDSQTMWKHRRELYEKVGRLRLFVQILTRSQEELATRTEPTFLANIMRDGQALYSRFPFTYKTGEALAERMILITYKLRGLPHREKLKLAYRLFGKGKKKAKATGVLAATEGRHLSPGCLLIPTDRAQQIIQVLNEFGVKHQELPIATLEPKGLIPLSGPLHAKTS